MPGRSPLAQGDWGKGGEIWGNAYHGSLQGAPGREKYYEFFVGTESQYAAWTKEGEPSTSPTSH